MWRIQVFGVAWRQVRVAFLLLAMLLGGGACDATEPELTTARVDYVYDGDSFVMRGTAGSKFDVRLAGIDAPEKGQPYSDQSRRALIELIDGRELTLLSGERDRYNRQVATAMLPGGTESVNAILVRQGHAWAYPKYDPDGLLRALQDQARGNRRGLWGARKTPIEPWAWRRGNHGKSR